MSPVLRHPFALPTILPRLRTRLFPSTSSLNTPPTSTTTRPLHSTPPAMRPLTVSSLAPNVLNVEYAVRGELAIKAENYRVQLADPNYKQGTLPFDRVISTNIGNPQQKGLDQPPLTFWRQVAALTEYPELMKSERGRELFPSDVIERAKELLEEIGSIGAYSHSQGVPLIRKHVAEFIEQRDGFPSSPSNIFLTAGASAGVSLILNMLISSPNKTGVLIPIPQYPLYTATLAQYSGVPVPYYLDESSGWSTAPSQIEEAIAKAQKEGVDVKALVVINPGNPTGSVLDEQTQKDLVKLCEKHSLVLLADEVYQINLHRLPDHPFTSFKRIVSLLSSEIPLFSFHSISKGVFGECGRRGGYFECTNISPEVLAMIYKMVSVGLCPSVSGQVGVECMVRPPKKEDGDGSTYELWKKETDAIHAALRHRTKTISERLNALPGVSCVDSPGSLYLFPNITLPPNAISAAQKENKAPDTFYALALLDATGICTVSGSGFGQREGTWHVRLTCLCAGVEEYIGKLEKFHWEFMRKYGGV